ncbi:MAG: hypothetical protein ACREE3_15285, partial [Stellaceae bacterium]
WQRSCDVTRSILGILGGSGLYELPSLSSGEWQRVSSPWGEPSDAALRGEVDGLEVAKGHNSRPRLPRPATRHC